MNEEKHNQYVFKFECAETWENLSETQDKNVRHCGRCERNVHLVQNAGEFDTNMQKGNCVYIPEMRTAGIPVYTIEPKGPKFEELKFEDEKCVSSLPLWGRLIQFVTSFIIALPIVSSLPFYIQKTMIRSQTSGGDVIYYEWKFRTLYNYVFDYDYFRPEENFAFFLAVNVVLACIFAFIIAFVIVLFIMSRDRRRIKIGNGK